MKIVSKAQARFLGAVASGRAAKKKGGPSRAKARKMLRENRGFKMGALPERAPSRKVSRASGRNSYRR